MYSEPIDIAVQSKYPQILKTFREGFENTTKQFNNLRLLIIDGKDYGAKVINLLIGQALKEKRKYFGVFNDDLWFVDGWLEDCLKWLQEFECVSAGYAETDIPEHFRKTVNETKNAEGTIPLLYGANYIFQTRIFKEIGIFDERYSWSCDDLDWAWRIRLNGLKSVTSKKVTMAHQGWVSMPVSQERRLSDVRNKELFYQKHGYNSYKHLRDSYKGHYEYFGKFKKHKNAT